MAKKKLSGAAANAPKKGSKQAKEFGARMAALRAKRATKRAKAPAKANAIKKPSSKKNAKSQERVFASRKKRVGYAKAKSELTAKKKTKK